MNIGVRDLRRNLSTLLDRVASGEEVSVLRRGRVVARLVPPHRTAPLPDMSEFRNSIKVRGAPMSVEVVRERGENRY